MEKNTIDVSVVIPVYNAELFFPKCIESVLSQTLQNIEIILVDDGSTDQSGSMCDAYSKKDERVRVFHLKNGGPARARNFGISHANGKYIGFVDSDDYVDHTMFFSLYKKAEEKQSDIAMCGYSVEMDGEISPINMDYEPLYFGNEKIKTKLLQRYYTENHPGLYSMCNKLFLRTLIVNNNIKIDESLRRGEDAWFVFDCLKTAHTVAYLPKALYYYVQNPTSIMHAVSKDQFEKWSYSRNRLLEENRQLQLTINFDLFYKDYLYKIANYCREMVRRNEIDFVMSIFKDPVFVRALPYRNELPIHVRLLHWLIEKRCYNFAILIYRIWCLW